MHTDISRCLIFYDSAGHSIFRGLAEKHYWIPSGWRVKRSPEISDMARRMRWKKSWSQLQWYSLCDTSFLTRTSDTTRYKVGVTYRSIYLSPQRPLGGAVHSIVETSFLAR